MSCILGSVFVCHEVLLVSSFSVISRAASSVVEVNKETTSKEIMISSGSTWMSFIFYRKALTFLIECGDVLTRGLRISARYFDKL
jgi:hypothetical protein